MKKLYFTFPGGARNCLTFSYDDGVLADKRLVEMFNKHGLKGTFNLNASLLGNGKGRVGRNELESVYAGHEIASHGYRHLQLNELTPGALRSELRDGREALEDLLGRPVTGFASPYGAHGTAAVEAMRETGFAYARTVRSSHECFYPPQDWMIWNPTSHHHDERLPGIADRLIADTNWGGTMNMLYVWGHSYEFDQRGDWDEFDAFCAKFDGVGADRLWRATNLEIHDYVEACRMLRVTADGTFAENVSSIPLHLSWGEDHADGKDAARFVLKPGEAVDLAETPDGATPVPTPIPERDRISSLIRIDDRTDDIESVGDDAFTPAFPGFRRKALTFSYDDGAPEDVPLAALFARHGAKCSFNLNQRDQDKIAERYAGHEVCVHGKIHATWNSIAREDVVSDIWNNRLALEARVRYPVTGSAYPCGEHSSGPRAVDILSALGIVHGRVCAYDRWFAIPRDFLRWNPTMHHTDAQAFEVVDKFIAEEPQPCGEPMLCYIWGHSFEFRTDEDWKRMEELVGRFDGHDEIWRATNIEIQTYATAWRSLVWSSGRKAVFNPTAFPVCGFLGGRRIIAKPGLTKLR